MIYESFFLLLNFRKFIWNEVVTFMGFFKVSMHVYLPIYKRWVESFYVNFTTVHSLDFNSIVRFYINPGILK